MANRPSLFEFLAVPVPERSASGETRITASGETHDDDNDFSALGTAHPDWGETLNTRTDGETFDDDDRRPFSTPDPVDEFVGSETVFTKVENETHDDQSTTRWATVSEDLILRGGGD